MTYEIATGFPRGDDEGLEGIMGRFGLTDSDIKAGKPCRGSRRYKTQFVKGAVPDRLTGRFLSF